MIGDGIVFVDVLKKVFTAFDGGDMRLLDFKRRAVKVYKFVLVVIWVFIMFIFVCIYGVLKVVFIVVGLYDMKIMFKGSRSSYAFLGKWRVVVCLLIFMEDVKKIKNGSGCMVNDIVVVVLVGVI